MNTWNMLNKRGPAVAVALSGVLVLATGCAADRVTYVRSEYPVVVQPPEPAPPAVVIPPSPAMELPPAPPPGPVVQLRSAAELDQMLGPIALYPDPLLAQLLPAATLPEQVVIADRYLREGGDVNQIDAQPWDNSVKALARYPATLKMLDDNLAWTTDLGQAFVNQPADVMDAVQRLRAQAQALGNLQSTPQQTVEVNDGIIEIVPPTPQVIYVPVYQPEVVYVQRPPAPGRFFISFGTGFAVGAWLNHDCDWRAHEVIVWHHDHPRPPDWWYRPPSRREPTKVVNNVTVVNNTTIVNHNVTVWHPRTRNEAADRGDRGWGQANGRGPAPAKNEAARPARDSRPATVVAHAQNPVSPKDTRPAQPVRPVPQTQPEVQRPAPQAPAAAAPAVREAVKPSPFGASRDSRTTPARDTRTVQPPVSKAPTPVAAPANPPEPARIREEKPTPRANPAVAAPKDARPASSPFARNHEPARTNPLRPAAPATTPHPVAKAPAQPAASALTGIENSQATREASARGQQSRQAVSRPGVTVHPASSPAPSPKANSPAAKKPQNGRSH